MEKDKQLKIISGANFCDFYYLEPFSCAPEP